MDNNEKAHGMMSGTVRRDDLEETICIPRMRYENLVYAEAEREILFHAYQQMDKFDLERVMDAIFNPEFKYKEHGDA